jgi:hypothetical protein
MQIHGKTPSMYSPETTANHRMTENPSVLLVEQLFDKFASIYGATFMAKWQGINPEKIKATWSRGLMAYTRAEIVQASDNLPPGEFPPSLTVFLEICRNIRALKGAAYQRTKALKHKIDPNDPEIVAARERCYETAKQHNMAWVFKALGGQA